MTDSDSNSEQFLQANPHTAGRDSAWSPMVTQLTVEGAPAGAMNLNVEGRQPASPLQGFGQMWQKTFQVRLTGVNMTPAEVMQIWRENFSKFQPPDNRFYPTMQGVKPGAVLLIDAKVPPLPGLPSILPVSTGVLILYADDTMMTVMTPEGHPEAGWNTFSIFEEDDEVLVAQVQALCRPSDPLYEFFNRFMGASGQQDKIWKYVLTSLAGHFGVKEPVVYTKTLIDPKVQWGQAKNIRNNAAIRTVFYVAGTPFRWAGNRLKSG